MKFLIILIIFFQTLTILGEENSPIMLKIMPNFELKPVVVSILRAGVESVLTKRNYSLIDENVQKETLKEQSEQRKKGCYDDNCLVDTGKLLAAKALFIVNITKFENQYIFKVRLIDLKTGTTKKSSVLVYSSKLDNAKELISFAEKLTYSAFGLDSNRENISKFSQKKDDLIKVIFNSEPLGSKILVDGRFIGKTPAQAYLTKGKHIISISKKFYHSKKIEKELYIDKKFDFKLDPKYKTYRIKSNPSKAKVYYLDDKKESCITPCSLKVKIENREIKIVKKRYYSLKKDIPLLKKIINLDLKPKPQKNITINLNHDIFEYKILSGNCLVKISKKKSIITDSINNKCKVKFSSKYKKDIILQLYFDKNKTKNINFLPVKSYSLIINSETDKPKITITDQYNKKYSIKNYDLLDLHEGFYLVETDKKGYKKEMVSFYLNSNKQHKNSLAIDNIYDFFRPFITLQLEAGTKYDPQEESDSQENYGDVKIGAGLELWQKRFNNHMLLTIDTTLLYSIQLGSYLEFGVIFDPLPLLALGLKYGINLDSFDKNYLAISLFGSIYEYRGKNIFTKFFVKPEIIAQIDGVSRVILNIGVTWGVIPFDYR